MVFNLDKLLRPASVAIVGASEEGSGGRIMDALRLSGYRGGLFAVNPNRATVRGMPCYPRIQDIPNPVDCAYVATPAGTVLSVLDDLRAAGVGAAIVYATGFAEAGEEGRQLQERVADKARASGIALCGPCSLGLINGLDGFPAFIGSEGAADAGPVAVISQSAGFIDAVRTSGNGIHPGLLIASGNEAVLTAADYLTHVLEDERIATVGLALEAVRDVAQFTRAARRALELGKPLVVLKIGSSERGRAAALGHTGSLVGDDQVWDAFFERFHITRVRDLDEFIETLALFAAGFAPDGPRLGLIGTSGGKAGYYADLCESIGVTLADLDEATIAAIGAVLGPDSPGLNPVDSGVGGVSPRKLEECLLHLCRDPGVDVVGVYGDMPVDITRFPGYQGYCDNALEAARTVAGQSDKPIVYINTRSARTGATPELPRDLRVPVLHGAREALLAIGHLARWAAPNGPSGEDRDSGSAAVEGARALVRRASPVGDGALLVAPEAAAELLDLYGIARVAERFVETEADAVAAASGLGFPVAAKLFSPKALHKSDAGLVSLGLADPPSVTAAYRELHAAHAGVGGDLAQARLYVQRMLPQGVEVLAGLKVDADVGPVLVFGLGGIFVELLRAVDYRLLPITDAEIEELVIASPAHAILRGARGRPAADVTALLSNLRALARLGWDLRDELVEIDLNPLIVLPEGQGAWAVDARILARPSPQ